MICAKRNERKKKEIYVTPYSMRKSFTLLAEPNFQARFPPLHTHTHTQFFFSSKFMSSILFDFSFRCAHIYYTHCAHFSKLNSCGVCGFAQNYAIKCSIETNERNFQLLRKKNFGFDNFLYKVI